LQCPQEVFAQLFHDEANNEDFAAVGRVYQVWEFARIARSTGSEGSAEAFDVGWAKSKLVKSAAGQGENVTDKQETMSPHPIA
jgi:hypothetical protein